jgi:hypothetical protein
MGAVRQTMLEEMEREAARDCPECGGPHEISSNDGDGEPVPCMFCEDGTRESYERQSLLMEQEHREEMAEEYVTSFLFDLLRDHVCAGVVEKLVRESRDKAVYDGPGAKEQEALARYYARRLLGSGTA